MQSYQLAQINIFRMRGMNFPDPVMKEFVDNLTLVNNLAESSEGFVWRLKGDGNNATDLNTYRDEQVIINISVWKSIAHLENYVYKSLHTDFLEIRKEWFQKFGASYYVLWWIEENNPTVEETIIRLVYLKEQGASEVAFDFKARFCHQH